MLQFIRNNPLTVVYILACLWFLCGYLARTVVRANMKPWNLDGRPPSHENSHVFWVALRWQRSVYFKGPFGLCEVVNTARQCENFKLNPPYRKNETEHRDWLTDALEVVMLFIGACILGDRGYILPTLIVTLALLNKMIPTFRGAASELPTPRW